MQSSTRATTTVRLIINTRNVNKLEHSTRVLFTKILARVLHMQSTRDNKIENTCFPMHSKLNVHFFYILEKKTKIYRLRKTDVLTKSRLDHNRTYWRAWLGTRPIVSRTPPRPVLTIMWCWWAPPPRASFSVDTSIMRPSTKHHTLRIHSIQSQTMNWTITRKLSSEKDMVIVSNIRVFTLFDRKYW